MSHLRVQTGDVVDAGASLNVDTDDRPVNIYISIYLEILIYMQNMFDKIKNLDMYIYICV